ncbi:MAG TPA: hypothetical protein VGS02_06190 [Acidobacteriaceae bacterium]|nr:hypothetical protein [Acidobacteriaceae bacterium]
MIDPVAAPVDRFWHLTSTAWSAVSSLVAAVSVIALVAFNWRYLHWTRKLSDSAAEQASIARESLRKLEEQISSDLLMQHHAALAVLREVANRVVFWAAHFRTEVRSEQDPIRLIPDDWNVLVRYVSRHFPDSASKITATSSGLHNVEVELNRLVRVSENQRGPNSSLKVRYDSLATNLDSMRKLLNEIDAAVTKHVIRTAKD